MSANVKNEVDGDNDDNEYSDIDCKDCDVGADSDDDVDEEVDSGIVMMMLIVMMVINIIIDL